MAEHGRAADPAPAGEPAEEEPDSERPALDRWTLAWFVQGIRWRLIAVKRKGQWFYRGIRWRVISVKRKAQWAYRGVRWRVISRIRRFYWWRRRLLRRTNGRVRRVGWFIRRITRRRGLVSALRRSLRRKKRQGPIDAFLLTTGSGEETEKAERRLRRRVGKLAQRPLAPSREAEHLVADLAVPTKWRAATKRDIGAVRCVRLQPTPEATESDTVVALIPTLLSGRPVVETEMLGSNVVTLDEARVLDEVERMHLANDQLRRLITSPELGNRPRIGVILSTNRPQLLPQALAYLRTQALVDVELRIGVHGAQPPADLEPLVGGAIVDAELTTYDSETVFGEVLRDLTEQTDTEFFSKWDDDDHYSPNHLIDLWIAAQLTGRSLVGKAAEFVYLDERGIVVRRRGGPIHTDSRFLAGGALLVARDVYDTLGGWAPIPRSVDQDLIERFEKRGYPAFRAHGLGFVLARHSDGHTWDVDDTYFLAGATEAWGDGGLALAGVAAAADDAASHHHPPKRSLTLCVPNKDNAAAVQRLEHGWSDDGPIDCVVVADDRSDPPLRFTSSNDRLQVSRVPALDGFGAGRARHHVAREATSDVLAFADSDMHVSDEAASAIIDLHAGPPTAVHALLGFSSIDSEAGLAILQTDGLQPFEARIADESITGQLWREPHWARSADLGHPRSSSFRACVGGFLSVDQTVYAQPGGFRDVPVRGVEDVEFGYRLLATGCRQLVYRGPGIIHLGQRTFASELGGDEGAAREQALARWIPIWSRNLAERATTLTEDGGGDPVPLIAIPDSGQVCDAANDVVGPGTAIDAASDWSVLDAPFCIADRPLPESTIPVLSDVMRAFREGPCGEVVLLDEGQIVGRITALWALNRWRVLEGSDPILDHTRLEGAWSQLDAVRSTVADRTGSAFVSIAAPTT